MTPKIFEPSIVFHADAFRKWLEQPNDRPFAVAADSREEAIAFLARLFRHDRELSQAADRAAVFNSVDTLRTLARSSSPFIPVAGNAEVEREFADLYRRFPCIVIRPRNAVDSKPDAALELLGYDARRLIPLTLAGAWDAQSNGDREVLTALADGGWEQVEESIACLLQFDDCPVWSVAQYYGAQYGGRTTTQRTLAICSIGSAGFPTVTVHEYVIWSMPGHGMRPTTKPGQRCASRFVMLRFPDGRVV